MKIFRPIALFLALCLCAGCFDVTEEYWFKKDRSGRYELSFDMANMASMMSMMEAIAPKNDSLGHGPDMPHDTTYFLSNLPDSVKRRLPFPAVADQSSISMKMQGGFGMKFALNFQDVKQIGEFWQNINAMDSLSNNDALGSMAGFRSMLNTVQTSQDWQGKTLQMHGVTMVPEAGNPFGPQGFNNPVVKMMMGANKYRQKFHFASKVRSAKGRSIQHDGKEAWATYPLTDVIGDPTVLSCSIKIKR